MAGRYWMVCGALLAAVGVGLGAIGAHVLKERLSAEQLVTYETGVRYHLFHALALIVVGLVIERYSSSLLQASAVAMLLGIVLFSGGIYAWLATAIKPFVHIVPIGGLGLIVGWLLLAAGLLLGIARGNQ
ncbi:MAG TPA: DUF423 domain-containing protein [Pirellulales bacterium]|jgi:uncharacterized membrane protein YgdD (TMEM256/DUF423 family)|nr:DUF423 domain-containing protein [Pirellulales bacterium]